MAVDKLVDSTQLDADLTSVANAIRTKGGTSASLAFPSGFVSAIANIPSGGDPGDEFEWATTTNQVVTIGANSVTNTQAAKSFFDALASYNMCILLSPLTDANQFIYCGTSGAMRYRNGAIASTNIGTAYDAKLVEGTKYLLIGK